MVSMQELTEKYDIQELQDILKDYVKDNLDLHQPAGAGGASADSRQGAAVHSHLSGRHTRRTATANRRRS